MPSDRGGPDPLAQALAAQRAAFERGAPDYRARIAALDALRDGLHAHETELVQAVSDDYGGRAPEETLLLELFPLYEAIRHARRHLRRWMRRRRVRGTWALLPGRAFVMYQPLGVVGVVGAWNYQLLLTLGPVVDAIAAGNHVLLKPSEVTPRSAALIARIVAERFAPGYLAVITGGPETAAAFSALPFDHLVFTGSTRVGHLVMRAASEHLTPVTLELGGKSPAIVHESFPMDVAVRRIMVGKLYNAGQTCIAPDYLLVPAGREAEVEAIATRVARELYPTLADNPDYTRIVTQAHLDRLRGAVGEAEARGARVVRVAPAHEVVPPDDRLLAPTLVFGAPDDCALMQEEIFGPVLPVVPYRTLDEAIAHVNARPRPLALYYFDHDGARVSEVLGRTVSGGVTINDVLLHVAQPNLPFGGVGASGMGHYHGFDGFAQLSKKKGVMVQGRLSPLGLLFHPPYGARTRRLIRLVLRLARR
jgi:coniferyl-aldehyde dehydrogenase